MPFLPKFGILFIGGSTMNNVDVINMKPGEFFAAYEKVKAVKVEKKPINSAPISLEEQLRRFEAASFSDNDFQALHEDLLAI
jgi:hypothetical protein